MLEADGIRHVGARVKGETCLPDSPAQDLAAIRGDLEKAFTEIHTAGLLEEGGSGRETEGRRMRGERVGIGLSITRACWLCIDARLRHARASTVESTRTQVAERVVVWWPKL